MASKGLEAKVSDLTLEPQCKTILLIGSTGNGKSTLGNCLIDPSESSKEVFARGRDSKPLTQTVQCEDCLLRVRARKTVPMQIIDTPGLNDSAVKDLAHMIGIVEAVRNVREITACLLCVKFNAQIDSQYRTTVNYYRCLLPKLFQANVVVVFTGYAKNDYEIKKRKREGINPEAVIRNAIQAIVEAAELSYEPTYFCIDSLPLDEEEKYTIEAREAIIDYVGTLSGVDTSRLLVAKTPALQEIDRNRVCQLDEQITGYIEKLKQVKTEAGNALNSMEKSCNVSTRLRAEKDDAEAELYTIDTDELLIVKQWSINEEWKFLRTQSHAYDISSAWPVDTFNYWDNGHLDWREKVEHKSSVKGVVRGEFMRGLYGGISLATKSRVKNADRIVALKVRVSDIRDTLDNEARTTAVLREQNKAHEEEIASLEKYIQGFEDEKAVCLRKRISLELASKRLGELQSKTKH